MHKLDNCWLFLAQTFYRDIMYAVGLYMKPVSQCCNVAVYLLELMFVYDVINVCW